MKVLVLGGTRFIGPPAVKRLVGQGHEVAVFHRGLDRTNETPLPPEVRHILGDRKQIADSAAAFREFAPEVVLDMMAMTEADGQMLLTQFRGLARRVVAISSCDVYRAYDRLRGVSPGPPDTSPMTEDNPLREKLYPYRDNAKDENDLAYSYDKILMERAVQSSLNDFPATVLRLPMVYGPHDYQRRVLPYLKRMDDKRDFILLSEEGARWIAPRGYVEDMSEAIALCVTNENAAGRIYHAADKRGVTEREWVERIAGSAGWTGEIVTLAKDAMPEHLKSNSDYSQDWDLDSARIRTELGYAEITPPADAMARTIAWQREKWPAEFDATAFNYPAEDAVIGKVVSSRVPACLRPTQALGTSS